MRGVDWILRSLLKCRGKLHNFQTCMLSKTICTLSGESRWNCMVWKILSVLAVLIDTASVSYNRAKGDRQRCQVPGSTMGATHVALAAIWKGKMWSNALCMEDCLGLLRMYFLFCIGFLQMRGACCVLGAPGAACGLHLSPPLSVCMPH